jgi:Pilus formation protein N terminal region
MIKSLTKLAILAGFAALPLLATSAKAEDLVVQYDQARLLTLTQPAANIIVGNPSIADVTLKSTKLLVVTGKTFGVTNLMVLNDEEKVIYSSRVMVRADESKVVTLSRADAQFTYACTPICQPVLKVGDDEKHYQGLAVSAQQKMKLSEGGPDNQQSGN